MSTSSSRRTGVVSVLIVAFLVAAEIIARLAGWPHFPPVPAFPQAPEWSYPRFIAKDTELFWRYRPDQRISGDFFRPETYTINNHGFRGPDFEVVRPEGRKRVVCLGGSTTFGLGVADGRSYPRQLELQLNRLDTGGVQWDVINAGVTNYSSLQGVRLAERWLPQLKPDVVIVNYSWGDHQRANAGISDQDRDMPPDWQVSVANAMSRSAAVQWLQRAWLELRPPALPDTNRATVVWRVDLTEFNANIERITRSARSVGAQCIVVSSPISWPPPGMSDTSGVFHYHHRYHRVARYAAGVAGAQFCELANYVNLHPEFFDNARVDHELFNDAGHAFAGDIIARCILGLPLDSARVFDVRDPRLKPQ